MKADELARQIAEANRQYYDDGKSDWTDDEYDAMVDEMTKLDPDWSRSTLTPPPSGTDWPIVEHLRFMGGIRDKIADEIDLARYDHGTAGWSSNKLDGLAVELQYRHGALKHVVLRGDGHAGEDVMANARFCKGFSLQIGCSEPEFAAYGELVVPKAALAEINASRQRYGLNEYKNPRNAASMIRRRDIPHETLERLMIVFYDCHPRIFVDQASNMQAMERCRKFFCVIPSYGTLADAWKRRHRVMAVRDEIPWDLDGLVFMTIDDRMFKLKFDPMAEATTVTSIREQLGRTGIIAPVCEFETVRLAGADVSRASIHNASLAASKLVGIGPGARVIVSRRGDVIPHVEAVIAPSIEPWRPMDKCPSCGGPIYVYGAIRRCHRAEFGECAGTNVGLMRKFCMEIGVDGFGAGVLQALYDSGVAKTPADLYSLYEDSVADVRLSNGSRIGGAIAKKLVFQMARRAEFTWGELLGSLGIPRCGKSVMEAVCATHDGDELLDGGADGWLLMIDGIGPERAQSILDWIHDRWDDVVAPLLEVVAVRSAKGSLSNASFCITLGLKSGSRPKMEARIRMAGGMVKSSVSKQLSFLVCNEPDANTTKLKKAREYGVQIISEATLIEMMGDGEQDEVAPSADDPF